MLRRTAHTSLFGIASAAALVTVGCGAVDGSLPGPTGPVGDRGPLIVTPDIEPVRGRSFPFAADRIQLTADGADTTTILGLGGAAPPETTQVLAINLDRPSERREVAADQQGFTVTLPGKPTDRYRLATRWGLYDSLLQSDVTVGPQGSAAVDVEEGHCVLHYSGGVHLDFGQVATGQRTERKVSIRHRCTTDVELRAAGSLGDQRVALVNDFTATRLRPGEQTEVTVVFAPSEQVDYLEFVFVDLGPDQPRLIVTVEGTARAGPD